jgi:hypothetical protein
MKKVLLLLFSPVLFLFHLEAIIDIKPLKGKLVRIKSNKNNQYFSTYQVGNTTRLKANATPENATLFKVKNNKGQVALQSIHNNNFLYMDTKSYKKEFGGYDIQLRRDEERWWRKKQKKGYSKWFWLKGKSLQECGLRNDVYGIYVYIRGPEIKVTNINVPAGYITKPGNNPNPLVVSGTNVPGSMVPFGQYVDKADYSLTIEVANPIPENIIKNLENKKVQLVFKSPKKPVTNKTLTLKKKGKTVGFFHKKRYLKSQKNNTVDITGKKFDKWAKWTLYSFEKEPQKIFKNVLMKNKGKKRYLTIGPDGKPITKATPSSTKNMLIELKTEK